MLQLKIYNLQRNSSLNMNADHQTRQGNIYYIIRNQTIWSLSRKKKKTFHYTNKISKHVHHKKCGVAPKTITTRILEELEADFH